MKKVYRIYNLRCRFHWYQLLMRHFFIQTEIVVALINQLIFLKTGKKLTIRKAAPINRFLCSRSRSFGKTRPKHCWLANLLSGSPSHSDFNLPIFAAWKENQYAIKTHEIYISTYGAVEQANLFNAAHVSPRQHKEEVAFVILNSKSKLLELIFLR